MNSPHPQDLMLLHYTAAPYDPCSQRRMPPFFELSATGLKSLVVQSSTLRVQMELLVERPTDSTHSGCIATSGAQTSKDADWADHAISGGGTSLSG